MRVFGLLVALILLVLAIILGSPLLMFVDVRSTVLVLGVGSGCWVAAHGLEGYSVLVNVRTAEDARRAQIVAETGARSFIAAGWLGVLIGAVQILVSLDDPSALGPAMAVCLLTAFYGHTAAALFWNPLAARHRARAIAGD